MNCTNCNAPLEPNAKFCGECGHLVSEKAVHASSELLCTNCGVGIEPGFQFCGECGHPVSAKPLSSGPIHPEATLIEQVPSPPMAKPPAEVRSIPTREPKEASPVPPPRVPPVAPSPPSAAPTVMAQDVTPPPSPPPQRAAAPPPRMSPQPAAVQHAQEPPQKKRSGCTIVIIVLAIVAICCIGSLVVGWYFISNAEYDFSSSGFDMPFLDQFQEGDLPSFLDQFLGEGTPDEFFDDFFSGQVGLTLQNSSDIPACFVYISPSVSDDWGEDWLGDDEVISPGDTMTFQLEPNQIVDIYTLDCDGDLLYEEYEIDLASEEILIILEPGP